MDWILDYRAPFSLCRCHMVLFISTGTPIETSKYNKTYYGTTPKKIPLTLGNPHVLINRRGLRDKARTSADRSEKENPGSPIPLNEGIPQTQNPLTCIPLMPKLAWMLYSAVSLTCPLAARLGRSAAKRETCIVPLK